MKDYTRRMYLHNIAAVAEMNLYDMRKHLSELMDQL